MLLTKPIYNKSRKNKKRNKSRRYKQKISRGGADNYYILTTLNNNDQFDTYIISENDAKTHLFEDKSDIMTITEVSKIEHYYKDETNENKNNISYGKPIDLKTGATPFTINPDNKILLTSNKVKIRETNDKFFIVWIWTKDIPTNNNELYTIEEWTKFNITDHNYLVKLKRYYMQYSNKDIIKPLNYINYTTEISKDNILKFLYISIKQDKDMLRIKNIINDPIVDPTLQVDHEKNNVLNDNRFH
jgi:hypothetical protein